MAVKAKLAEAPHGDLLRPDLEGIETARRAELVNEAQEFFHDGLLSHEILERYPEERDWMKDRLADLEVVFRREQIQFVESIDKPKPVFSAPKPERQPKPGSMVSLPALAIDRPHLKAVAISVDVCSNKSGEITEEMVWFPRSQVENGEVPKWLVEKKLEELQKKHRNCCFSGLPE